MSRNHEAGARWRSSTAASSTTRRGTSSRTAPASVVERMRNEVSLSALRSLVTHMGSLREGRKAVILVSEGYSNYLPPQLRDPIASMPGFGNPARQSPTAGAGEDRERFFSSAEMIGDLRQVCDVANRNNTAIYALDPRGLPFEFDINEGVGDTRVDATSLRMTRDTLRILADETDGRAIVNQNDLDKESAADRQRLERVLPDRLQLLAGAAGRQVPRDQGEGEAVRGAGASPERLLGADGRSRPVPCSAAPEPPRSSKRRSHQSPRPAAQASSVRAWIGTARGERQDARDVVWSPRHRRQVSAAEAARVSVTAMAPDGSAYFRGRVLDVTVASAAPQAAAASGGGVPARGPAQVVFEAPPGRCSCVTRLRTRTQVSSTPMFARLRCQILTAPQVQLSTPRAARAR